MPHTTIAINITRFIAPNLVILHPYPKPADKTIVSSKRISFGGPLSLALLLCVPACAQVAITAEATSPNAESPTSIRFGAPILLSGRVFPADATGALTFSIDGIPAQTAPLTQQTFSDFAAIGDSITYAGAIADPVQRFQNIIANTLNLSGLTYASPNATACDVMLTSVLPNGIGIASTSSPLYSVTAGTTDAVLYGTGTHEALFNQCHQALLGWLAVPRTSKVLIGDSGAAILNGSWTSTANNTLTTTSGGTVRFNLTTNAGAAYLWYLLQAGSAGSLTVSVDNGASDSPASTLLPSTSDPATSAVALLRIPVAAGSHTFAVTAQSGTVSILGMGSAPAARSQTVLVSDVPNQSGGVSSVITAYTADIQGNIALLLSDGLDLRFVPTQQYMSGTASEMIDTQNPNALGLSEIAQAFLSSASPIAGSISAASASYTISTIAIGTHKLTVDYSGDSRYPASTVTIPSLTIYDPSSTALLTSNAYLIPTATPITVTATILQSNASGAVNFIDTTPSGTVSLGSVWLVASTATLTRPSLNGGNHTITAQYLGDIHFNASSSAPISVTVSGTYTTTLLTAPATRYDTNAPVQLTAVVSPATATGSITFFDGALTLAQVPIASGIATFNISTLTPGIHSLTASYSGDTALDSSTSPTLAVEIDPNPTVISITPPPVTMPYGNALTLTAAVSPASATGSITFADGTQTLGQATLANGVASFTPATLAPGTHIFSATYSGDANDLPSVSSAISTQVTLDPSTITLAAIPASTTFGTALALSASVAPASATGTVTFTDSISGTLAQVGLTNGLASSSTASLAPGVHTLYAGYSGDSFRAASTSAALTVTVNPITSSIVLAAPAATMYLGNPLSLSASITPASATGTVTFRDATRGTLGQTTTSNGTAAIILSNPTQGAYSITASYSGDGNDTAASSNAVTTQISLNPTSLTLTSSANPPFTLIATLASPTATGTVTFLDGTTILGTVILSSGSAAFTTPNLTPGTHTLRASYSGDALNAASESATLSETINAGSTATSLSLAQTSVVIGASIFFNVHVSSTNAIPTGTITIRSGASTLASAPIANAGSGKAYATLTINSASLGLGTFPITAFYSGDANDQPSDSAASAVSIAITPIPTSATLALSFPQIAILGTSTLTAAVTSPNAIPTGSITFFCNGIALSTIPLGAAGAASYTLAADSIGTYAISAVYTPTGSFATTTIAPATLLATAPLTAAINPASISPGPGSTTSATLTITPLSSFTGSIQTLCQTTVGFVTCTLSAPATITGPITVPVQISVSRSDLALVAPTQRGALPIALALALPLLTLRRYKRPLSLLCIALLSLYLSGCAEGGNFSDIPAGVQTVAITITAAGVPFTSSLTVNVQQ